MNFRAFILLITLILPSVCYAAVPPYIKGDTIENICQKVVCHKDINKTYKSYYTKQFSKAFAISSYKSGNKYYIDYAGWSSKKPSRLAAEMAALRACRKHAKHYCKVLFLGNAIYNEDLYVLLTQTTTSKSSSSSSNNNASSDTSSSASNSSTSSTKTNDEYVSSTLKGEGFLGKILNKIGLTKKKIYIPYNAYAYGSSWKCETGYLKKGNYCRPPIINGYWASDGSSFQCNSGYTRIRYHCEKEKSKLLDSDFWFEEVEPGKNRLFKLGELLNYYGKTPKQRSQSTFNSNLINSRIEDEFEGYEYGNLYRLTNGQVWEQTSSTYKYKYKYRPRVTISNGNMFVEGMSKSVKVRRY